MDSQGVRFTGIIPAFLAEYKKSDSAVSDGDKSQVSMPEFEEVQSSQVFMVQDEPTPSELDESAALVATPEQAFAAKAKAFQEADPMQLSDEAVSKMIDDIIGANRRNKKASKTLAELRGPVARAAEVVEDSVPASRSRPRTKPKPNAGKSGMGKDDASGACPDSQGKDGKGKGMGKSKKTGEPRSATKVF